MQPTFNFFQIIFLLSAIQGFILSGLILRKEKKRLSSIFLGLFILVFALASLKIVLQETISNFNYKLPLPLLYQFAFGPLLYGYVRSSLNPEFRFTKKEYWHFFPVLLFDVMPALAYFSLGPDQYNHQVPKIKFSTDILAFISFVVYWSFAWRYIKGYKQQLRKSRFTTQPIVIGWLNQLIVASVLIVLCWAIYLFLVLSGYYKYFINSMLPYYPAYIVMGMGIYWIGIRGYFQPHIYLIDLPTPEKKELLTPSALEGKKALLLAAVKEHRYYYDENISVQALAQHLNLPVKELSYVINTGFGQHFNDFINQLRVEDLKERLLDPGQHKYSIMGLATEVGFNSKPSFYRAFKKFTGQTPSEFLKKHAHLAD